MNWPIFSTPSPIMVTGSFCKGFQLSSVIITASTAPSGINPPSPKRQTCAYTSSRRASKTVITNEVVQLEKSKHPKVGTLYNGIPKAKHKPFAVLTPKRKPVYEPGPLPTQIPVNAEKLTECASSSSLISTCKRSPWIKRSPFSARVATICWPSQSAILQFLVAVSIQSSTLIFYPW